MPSQLSNIGLSDKEAFRIPFQSLRVIFALFIREMTTDYGRSWLGFLWAFLEPLGSIAILALAFSLLFKSPSLGDSFILFYATGYLPYVMYIRLNGNLAGAIRQNRSLLFYPAVTFLDVIIARALLNIVSEVTVMAIIFTSIIMTQQTGASIRPDRLILAVLINISLGSGIGMINSVLYERFPSWRILWQIFNRPMFFMSGVLFVVDNMPSNARDVLTWNPLCHIIGIFREGIYPEYTSDFISVTYAGGTSLVLLAIGLALLLGSHRFIINN